MPLAVPQINAVIPDGINDLESYRRWVHSDEFPEQGKFAYLDGTVWMDLTMEQAHTHNRLKTRINSALSQIGEGENLGQYYSDGMLLSNPQVRFATEPDGMFLSFDSIRRGVVREMPGSDGGCIELIGAPDMVLEVVSKSSVNKDTIELVELYWLAGVREYWLVDGRGEAVRFELFRRGATEFEPTPPEADGFLTSKVFGRSFRLVRAIDLAGNPAFTLEVR